MGTPGLKTKRTVSIGTKAMIFPYRRRIMAIFPINSLDRNHKILWYWWNAYFLCSSFRSHRAGCAFGLDRTGRYRDKVNPHITIRWASSMCPGFTWARHCKIYSFRRLHKNNITSNEAALMRKAKRPLWMRLKKNLFTQRPQRVSFYPMGRLLFYGVELLLLLQFNGA